MPWYIKYDSVKVETYNEKKDSFEFLFEDNFDTFDESRWRKARGYGYATTNFHESQVYVDEKNGHLVIKLEKEGGDDEEEVKPPTPEPTPEPTP